CCVFVFFFFQAEDGIRDWSVTGVQTCALPISGIVVLDEAYHAFAGRSFMGSIARYSNLLVMRTVSKLGLAGIRLGALVGPEAWRSEERRVGKECRCRWWTWH